MNTHNNSTEIQPWVNSLTRVATKYADVTYDADISGYGDQILEELKHIDADGCAAKIHDIVENLEAHLLHRSIFRTDDERNIKSMYANLDRIRMYQTKKTVHG